MGVISLDISARDNQPPSSSGWFSISMSVGQTHTFSKGEFENTNPPYIDPENDALSEVKIVTLPGIGALKKNGVDVIEGDVITVGEMDSNLFTYVSDALITEGYGDSEATFLVADAGSSTFTSSPQIIAFEVSGSDNLAPSQVGDGDEDIALGSTFTFTRASLTSQLNPPYEDPEGNPASMLLIVSLPTYGTLKLNGVPVVADQEISFSTHIDNSLFVYESDELPLGGIEGFEFKISDTGSGEYRG